MNNMAGPGWDSLCFWGDLSCGNCFKINSEVMKSLETHSCGLKISFLWHFMKGPDQGCTLTGYAVLFGTLNFSASNSKWSLSGSLYSHTSAIKTINQWKKSINLPKGSFSYEICFLRSSNTLLTMGSACWLTTFKWEKFNLNLSWLLVLYIPGDMMPAECVFKRK